MKRFAFLFALMACTFALFSQEEEGSYVSADRPGMSTGPDVTPFLKVQWETGFESTLTGEHTITLPTTMIRFGVTRFAELRLEFDGVLSERYKKKWEYEVCPLVLGTKVKIFDGYKWVPKISLMANLSIPLTREQLHGASEGATRPLQRFQLSGSQVIQLHRTRGGMAYQLMFC